MGNEIIRLIFEAIFLGFGFCSVLVFILSFFANSNFKNTLASYFNYGTIVIRISGIVYFFYHLILLIQLINSKEPTVFSERAIGPYASFYWYLSLRPFLYCLLTQLFWIKKLRKVNIRSLLLVLLLFFISIVTGRNLEYYVIVITSIHRDYLPNDWQSKSILELLLGIVLQLLISTTKRILFFSVLVGITWLINQKIIKKNGIKISNS